MKKTPIQLVLLGFFAFLLIWVSSSPKLGGPGLTWDEAYYYKPYHDVASWSGLLVRSPGTALSHEGILAGWEDINELPPVVKWLGAISVAIAPEAGWNKLWVMRLMPALAFALSLIAIYLIGSRISSRVGGWLSLLLYVSIPRVLGHAQIAATETVFVCISLWTVYAALRSHDCRKWKVTTVILLGLLLATKVNGIIFMSALIFWYISERVVSRGTWNRPGEWFKEFGWLFLAVLVFIPPVIAFCIWPWLWYDTLSRIVGYYEFIKFHSHQPVWFLGEKYNFNPDQMAPLYYPILMFFFTVPLYVLVPLFIGLTQIIVSAMKKRRINAGIWLVSLVCLASILSSSLPSAPKYDGVRLFFPFFAPLCLLGGVGASRVLLTSRFRNLLQGPTFRHVLGGLLLVLIGLRAFFAPQLIDYYSPVSKMVPRANSVYPFELTYWLNAFDKEVVDDLNSSLQPSASIKSLAFQELNFEVLQDMEVLRTDLNFDLPPPYDYHLIQTRRGFWGNAEWSIYASRDPLMSWNPGIDGEPRIYLYDGRPPGM